MTPHANDNDEVPHILDDPNADPLAILRFAESEAAELTTQDCQGGRRGARLGRAIVHVRDHQTFASAGFGTFNDWATARLTFSAKMRNRYLKVAVVPPHLADGRSLHQLEAAATFPAWLRDALLDACEVRTDPSLLTRAGRSALIHKARHGDEAAAAAHAVAVVAQEERALGKKYVKRTIGQLGQELQRQLVKAKEKCSELEDLSQGAAPPAEARWPSECWQHLQNITTNLTKVLGEDHPLVQDLLRSTPASAKASEERRETPRAPAPAASPAVETNKKAKKNKPVEDSQARGGAAKPAAQTSPQPEPAAQTSPPPEPVQTAEEPAEPTAEETVAEAPAPTPLALYRGAAPAGFSTAEWRALTGGLSALLDDKDATALNELLFYLSTRCNLMQKHDELLALLTRARAGRTIGGELAELLQRWTSALDDSDVRLRHPLALGMLLTLRRTSWKDCLHASSYRFLPPDLKEALTLLLDEVPRYGQRSEAELEAFLLSEYRQRLQEEAESGVPCLPDSATALRPPALTVG